MSDLEDTLTKGKIAGIPVWGAGVGMAALFIGFAWWRSRNTSSPTPTAGPIEDIPDAGLVSPEGAAWGLPPGPIGDWLADNPQFGGYPVGFSLGGLPPAITNVQWSRLVSDELLARGSDPALVQNALTKYLNSQTLSPAEQAIINLALKLVGEPPEGLLPVVVNPPPPPPPPGGGTNPPPGGTPSTDLQKVTGVTASTIWTFAIEVHWKAVPGADSYKVTVSPMPELGSEKTAGPITGKMLIGPQSMAGQTFTITVAARKGSSVGPASDPVSIHVPTAGEGGHTS